MKYKYHKFEFDELPKNWLDDSYGYSGIVDSDGDPEFVFRKSAAGKLTVKFVPSYGSTFILDDIPAQVCGRQLGVIAEFVIIWKSPSYRIFVNADLVCCHRDELLAEAAELGVSLEYMRSLSPVQKYKLKKTVSCDQGDEAWELCEIPNFITHNYGLSPENFSEFLRTPSNSNQNHREVVATWCYAFLLNKLIKSDDCVSLISPGIDRGVDVFIRLQNTKDPVAAMIPIQVCEIPMEKNVDFEQTFIDRVSKAKGHGGDRSATLLCSVIGEDVVAIDMEKLRKFASYCGDWPYSRVVFVTKEPLMAVTLYDLENQFYFMTLKEGSVEVYSGKTIDEMNYNRINFDKADPPRLRF